MKLVLFRHPGGSGILTPLVIKLCRKHRDMSQSSATPGYSHAIACNIHLRCFASSFCHGIWNDGWSYKECVSDSPSLDIKTKFRNLLEVPEFPLYSLLLEFCTTRSIVLGVLVLYVFVLSAFSRRCGHFGCNHRWPSHRQLLVNRIISCGLGPFNMGHKHFSAPPGPQCLG
jgi:hypothetical protein